MEGIAPNSMANRQVIEKKARPQEQLNCPRCTSTNTKFCYYNNYSLTQPRYFCKTCRRYWTEGGSLRNVPVGGGSRKNKNKAITTNSPSSSSTPSNSSSSKILPDLNPPTLASSLSSLQNPKMHGGQDLNLAFPPMENYHHVLPTTGPTASTAPLSALELLRSSMASRGMNMNNNNNPFSPNNNSSPLMPNSNALYHPSGFPMQEVKTTSLGFSVDQGNIGNSRPFDQERGLFPFGDVNKQLSASEVEHNKEQGNSSGYWSGMIGEGSW